MKRRFISFLSAVVVAFMSFAQTGNVVYSWESPEGTVIETGGTIAYVNGDGNRLNYGQAGYHTICLNGKKGNLADETASANAGRMVITLDEALQEGDSIYVTAFRNKNEEGKKATIHFLYENGTVVNDTKAFTNISADDADADYDDDGAEPNTHGYLVPAEAAGSKTITLTRNDGGTNLFITKFVIVRQAVEDAPVEPETPADPVVYTMVQNEADLVAGGKYLIMAEVDGGWVALSDQSDKIRVPSDTLTISENYTVETVVATAIAEAPAKFEGVAYALTLEGEAGAWKFKDELSGAYLHWASGNYLINDAEGSAWTIGFNQYGHNAVITHAVTTERVLQYNASAPRFCAYTSVQAPVYLFKAGEVTVAPVAPSNPSFNTIAELLAFEVGNVVDLNVNKAKITYLSGNNMSITDGVDTLAVYDYNIPADYAVGGWLSGKITATLGEYKGNKQLTVVDWSEVTFEAPVTVESPWVGAVAEAGATYYFYNPSAKAFLKAGNSWGTRASFGQDAYPIILEGADGVYALSTTLAFEGKGLRASDLFMDQSLDKFAFDEVGEGIYTIASGGKYVAYTGVNTVEYSAELNDGCYWQLLTKKSVVADMVAAGAADPYDVTALITCANFGRDDRSVSAWVGGPETGGDNPNFCGEKWGAGAFDVNQTLTGLPNGTYLLQAQGYYRVGGGANDATLAAEQYVAGNPALNAILYGNDAEMPLMSIMAETKAGDAPSGDYFSTSLGYVPQNMKGASLFFNEGLYEHAMYVTVTDGTLKIGIKKSVELANDWVIFDNFRLTYYGTATVEEIELAKLQEYIDAVTVLVNAAKAIDGTLADEVKAELDAAVAVAEAALAAPAQETLVAAVAPLEAAITRAERSVAINAAASTATLTAPVAFTQFVINPDMANGTINGWTTAAGWQFQSNMVYTGEGAELNKFQERWVAGAGLGNTSTMQTLVDMPNGIYRVSADVMATAQYDADPEGHTTGAYWVANKDSVAVATANEKPEKVSVDVIVTDGVLNIGLVGVNTTANWMGLDNVTVQYYGTEGSLEQLAKIEAFMNKCMELASLSESYSTMYMIPAVSAKFFAVQEPAFAMVDTITKVPLAEIDAQIVAMDETIAFVKAMDAKFNAWKDKLFVCYDYQDNYAASEEAVAAFAAVVNEHAGYQWSMPAETTAAMDSLVAVLDSVSRVYIEESFTFNLYAMAALYETCANMNFIPAASGKLETAMGYAGVLDTISKVATDTIIAHIAVVVEATEYVKAMDAKYAEWKEQLFVCYDYQDNATPASEESKAVLDSLVNVHMAYQWSMPATETAEIDAWIAEMKEACANYPVKVAYLCGATETTEAIYNALVAAYYNVTALNYDDVVLNDSIVNADFVGKYGVVVLAGGTGSSSNLAKAFNTLLGKVPVLSTKSFWYVKTTPAGTNGDNPGTADNPSRFLEKTVAEHPIYAGIEGETITVFNDMGKEKGRYLQQNGTFANNEPAQTTLGTANGADCIGEAWVGDMGWLIIPVDGAQPEGYLTEDGKALFVNAVAYLIAGEKYEAPVVEVATVTLDKTEVELTEAGATVQLTATVAPDNATDQTITWTSSDEKVATVDANGLVTAVANGTATITATAANGVKAECVVTVNIVDGIEAIEAVENAVIYTITGKAIQGDVKTLERGIYIINGKKVLVK